MHKFLATSLFIGKPIIIMPNCHSTNDIASDLAQKGEIREGGVIYTDHQTRGKGQRGNRWESEPGANLTFSVLFQPVFMTIEQQIYLNYKVSLSILDLLNQLIPGKNTLVKWPNDIYVGDKKLGGILIENALQGSKIRQSIVGIGLNINQMEFENQNAVSLSQISGQTYDLHDLLEKLLLHLESRYLQLKAGNLSRLKEEYLAHLYRKNEEHEFNIPASGKIRGKIIDVDESGRLVIETVEGLKRFNFKEIEFMS